MNIDKEEDNKAKVSKNKSSYEKVRIFFYFEAQSRYFAWLGNFDPGLFLTLKSKTQMNFYFLDC